MKFRLPILHRDVEHPTSSHTETTKTTPSLDVLHQQTQEQIEAPAEILQQDTPSRNRRAPMITDPNLLIQNEKLLLQQISSGDPELALTRILEKVNAASRMISPWQILGQFEIKTTPENQMQMQAMLDTLVARGDVREMFTGLYQKRVSSGNPVTVNKVIEPVADVSVAEQPIDDVEQFVHVGPDFVAHTMPSGEAVAISEPVIEQSAPRETHIDVDPLVSLESTQSTEGIISFEIEKKLLAYLGLKIDDRADPLRRPRLNMLRFEIDGDSSSGVSVEHVAEKINNASILNDREKKEMLALLYPDLATPSAEVIPDTIAPEGIITSPKELETEPPIESQQTEIETGTTPALPSEDILPIDQVTVDQKVEKVEQPVEPPVVGVSEPVGQLERGVESSNELDMERVWNEIQFLKYADWESVAYTLNMPKSSVLAIFEELRRQGKLSEASGTVYEVLSGSTSQVEIRIPERVRSEEEIRQMLSEARDTYVTETTAYNTELQKKKSKFRKVMTDLGFPGKQMPELEKSAEYTEAEKKYIEAKKLLRMKILERDEIIPLHEQGSKTFRKELMDEAEKEYALLRKKIEEKTPQKEKGMVKKGFEIWARMPLPARVAISTLTIAALTAALEETGKYFNIHIPGAHIATLGAAGLRFGRSLAGGLISQPIGKKVDSILRKKSETRIQHALENYVGEFDPNKFEEAEQKLTEFYQQEENRKKRNVLKKAGAMIATGAGVSIGAGISMNALADTVHSGGVHIPTHPDETLGGKHSYIPKHVSPTPAPEPVPTPLEVHPTIEPVRVELSSRGFIDTFSKLKAELAIKYADTTNVPLEIKHILNTPSTQLATEYGLYKPGEQLSAFGLKGEHLMIDSSGNLVVESHGTTHTLFDAKTGASQQYSGPMLATDSGKVSVQEQVPEQPTTRVMQPAEPTPVIPEVKMTEVKITPSQVRPDASSEILRKPEAESVGSMVLSGAVSSDIPSRVTATVESGPAYSDADALADTAVVATSVAPEVVSSQEKITIPESVLAQDLIAGKSPLLRQYQFGTQYKDKRNQYSIAFEKRLAQATEKVADELVRIPYQNGEMFIVQNGASLTMLLNGEIIGSGQVTENTVDIVYNKALGTGRLMKNGFEEAFQKAQTVGKQKAEMFQRNIK